MQAKISLFLQKKSTPRFHSREKRHELTVGLSRKSQVCSTMGIRMLFF